MKKIKVSAKYGYLKVFKNLGFMIKYSIKYAPAYIVVTLVASLGQSAWHIFSVAFTKYVFDAIELGIEFKTIVFWALLVAGYNAIFKLYNRWRSEVYVPKVKLILHAGIQNELYEKAKQLDQSCYDSPEFYNDFIWSIRESDSRTVQIVENIGTFVNRIVSSIGIFGLLASIDWMSTVIIFVCVGFGFILKNKLNQLHYKKNFEINAIDRKLSYIRRVFYLQEYAMELRQVGIAGYLRDEYKETTYAKVNCMKTYMRRIFGYSLLSTILTNVIPSTGVTGYLLVRYITDSSFSLGGLSASINASFKFYSTIDDIGNILNKFSEHSLYVEKVKKFIEYKPKITGDELKVPAFESLIIKNLDFAYPFVKSGKKSLVGINMKIKKGEKIAFVGYNGAGKTTLIKLLMRLYDPSSGDILYNGRNITEYDPIKYREHIGAVFQDFKIFATSIAENIIGGEYEDTNEKSVMLALKAASIENKVNNLPRGIHSQLTTEFCVEGVELSRGEFQKIAIARVFARPFELIIMDEPSSFLDPIAEFELNQSIIKNAEGRTVIFISHRLSATKMVDKIYMFEEGQIIECGSHEELMKSNGKYAQMYNVQANKYGFMPELNIHT